MGADFAGVNPVMSHCQVTGSVEYYRGFCLDQLGAPVVQINGELRLPEEGTVVYPLSLRMFLHGFIQGITSSSLYCVK